NPTPTKGTVTPAAIPMPPRRIPRQAEVNPLRRSARGRASPVGVSSPGGGCPAVITSVKAVRSSGALEARNGARFTRPVPLLQPRRASPPAPRAALPSLAALPAGRPAAEASSGLVGHRHFQRG